MVFPFFYSMKTVEGGREAQRLPRLWNPVRRRDTVMARELDAFIAERLGDDPASIDSMGLSAQVAVDWVEKSPTRWTGLLLSTASSRGDHLVSAAEGIRDKGGPKSVRESIIYDAGRIASQRKSKRRGYNIQAGLSLLMGGLKISPTPGASDSLVGLPAIEHPITKAHLGSEYAKTIYDKYPGTEGLTAISDLYHHTAFNWLIERSPGLRDSNPDKSVIYGADMYWTRDQAYGFPPIGEGKVSNFFRTLLDRGNRGMFADTESVDAFIKTQEVLLRSPSVESLGAARAALVECLESNPSLAGIVRGCLKTGQLPAKLLIEGKRFPSEGRQEVQSQETRQVRGQKATTISQPHMEPGKEPGHKDLLKIIDRQGNTRWAAIGGWSEEPLITFLDHKGGLNDEGALFMDPKRYEGIRYHRSDDGTISNFDESLSIEPEKPTISQLRGQISDTEYGNINTGIMNPSSDWGRLQDKVSREIRPVWGELRELPE